MKAVAVTGAFDDLRSRDIRFLQEASRAGPVHVLLLSDAAIRSRDGKDPKFPLREREYLVKSIRYVGQVSVVENVTNRDLLPVLGAELPGEWIVTERDAGSEAKAWCAGRGIAYRVLNDADLAGFPADSSAVNAAPRKKVVVTGCYDWFHSGHVAFFEEVSSLGELYVGIGSDANIGLLKGKGHPMFPQEERRYVVQAVRFVTEAFVSSGSGWLDAEPEITRIEPDIYAVNEDGDRPEKRDFCLGRGIEYRVLKRVPKQGLPKRESTKLRGF